MTNGRPASVDILVVDDDITFRDLLRHRLEGAGYTTEVAANGRIALNFLRDKPCQLIITDLFMPEADGIEVMLAMKDQQVPIITMSGSMSLDTALFRRVSLQLGAHETLLKPFSFDELLAAVRLAIGLPPRSSATPDASA
jgi:DNA-binding response OmpR family regulator